MGQISLFSNTFPHDLAQLPEGILIEEIGFNLAESTFVGELDLPVHRWYKLRPSFSPYLVRYLYERLATSRIKGVLDPFAGAGTTQIECKRLGVSSWGVELNPFLARYAFLALDWSSESAEIRSTHEILLERVRREIDGVRSLSLEKAAKVLGVSVPPIHDPLRWWKPDVLRDLLAVKRALYDQREGSTAYRVLWLALATVCIEVANIKRLHPTLTFHDRSAEVIDTYEQIAQKLDLIASDLASADDLGRQAPSSVVEGDSLKINELLSFPYPMAVITSPPYPNRYSYVWETRPHLYMMDLISQAADASSLDLRSPGGTWGVATSVLAKGVVHPRSDCLREVLKRPIGELRKLDNLMANYVVKYFNMMDEHFDALGRVLRPGSRFAYVVGNSRIKDVDIPTESILANQLNEKPWASLEAILIFRKRIGRKSLFEAALIGTRCT